LKKESWQRLRPTKSLDVADRELEVVSLSDAIESGGYTSGTVTKYFEDKGFGFITSEGETCFFHRSSIRIHQRLPLGSPVIFQVIRDLVQGDEKLKATTIWAEPDYRAEVAALAIAKAAKNTQRVVEQSLSCLWPPGLAKSAVANLGQAAVLDLVALKADDPGEPAAAPVFDPWALRRTPNQIQNAALLPQRCLLGLAILRSQRHREKRPLKWTLQS